MKHGQPHVECFAVHVQDHSVHGLIFGTHPCVYTSSFPGCSVLSISSSNFEAIYPESYLERYLESYLERYLESYLERYLERYLVDCYRCSDFLSRLRQNILCFSSQIAAQSKNNSKTTSQTTSIQVFTHQQINKCRYTIHIVHI